MPPSRTRLAPVDGLRGIAAFAVVISHVYQAANYPYLQYNAVFSLLDILRSGVDLFFVLSGFCLFYPLTKEGSTFNLRQFAYRRARRLLPTYYAALAAIILLPFLIVPLAGQVGVTFLSPSLPDWRTIWTHLLLVHTLFPDTFYALDGPSWSLGIEVQLYLAFPLAVWLLWKMQWRGVVLIAMITLGYRIAANAPSLGMMNWPIVMKDLFLSRWLEFGLGMLVAMGIRKRGMLAIEPLRELLDLTGMVVLFLIGAYYLYGPAGDWPYPAKDLLFAAASSAILYTACCHGSFLGRVLSMRALVWLGQISYSLYLIHLPLIFGLSPAVWALRLSPLNTFLVLSALGIPIALGSAAIFYWLFERPFLNAPRSATVRTEQQRQAVPRDVAEQPQRGLSRTAR